MVLPWNKNSNETERISAWNSIPPIGWVVDGEKLHCPQWNIRIAPIITTEKKKAAAAPATTDKAANPAADADADNTDADDAE